MGLKIWAQTEIKISSLPFKQLIAFLNERGESMPLGNPFRETPWGEIPMMGAEGIEPPSSALEADIIPVYYAPLIRIRKISFYYFLSNLFISSTKSLLEHEIKKLFDFFNFLNFIKRNSAPFKFQSIKQSI